jgi:hypothetical protein
LGKILNFGSVQFLRGVPGLGPVAALLSFASPKESKQRKGEQKPGPLRGALSCSHQAGSG